MKCGSERGEASGFETLNCKGWGEKGGRMAEERNCGSRVVNWR